ncbi:MAG: class I SAM-dependent methyltransferase [Bacteroidota bacterium]
MYLLLILGFWACTQSAQVSQDNPGSETVSTQESKTNWYSKGPRSYDGIGKYYQSREISQVMGHLGAGWLERPEREAEEKGSLMIQSLGLKPTDVVADIGAGSGYFTFQMAPLVPEGKVIAQDIQPQMIQIMAAKQAENGIENVEYVLGGEKNSKLKTHSVDWVLIVDVYHEFSYPREMMESIVKAMKPTARLALVEYRGEDPSVPIKPRHKMTEAQAVKEMKLVGLSLIENKDLLPRQHLMIFGKK